MSLNFKYKFELNEQDFLVHQLYSASINTMIKKRRQRSRFVVPLLYVVLFYLFFREENTVEGAVALFLLSVIWVLFYPRYSAWFYKRHYLRYIRYNFKGRMHREIELVVSDEGLKSKDESGESFVSLNELEQMVELPEHLILRLKSNYAITIPKKAVTDYSKLKHFLIERTISFLDESKWHWR